MTTQTNPEGERGEPGNEERRRPVGWLSINLPLKFVLAVSFTLSVASIITVTTIIDTGWDVGEGIVETKHTVSIGNTLTVRRDLVIGGDGSYLQIGAADCGAEGPSEPNTARLCFDQAEGKLMVSQNGQAYVSILRSPILAGEATLTQRVIPGIDREILSTDLPLLYVDPRDANSSDDVQGGVSIRSVRVNVEPTTAVIALEGDEILQAWQEGRLNVQLTPVEPGLPLGFAVDPDQPRVVISNPAGTIGSFYYLIQVIP